MRLAPILLLAARAWAADFPADLRLVRVATGLANPLLITHAGDGSGRQFIVEQAGRILILKNGVVAQRPFLDIRSKVRCCGEQGLLGLAFPPNFRDTQHFYVNYTDLPNGNTVIARYRVAGTSDLADAASEQILVTITQPFPNHNGGGIAFSPRDGRMYIGMGDGGSGGDPMNNAQNPNSLLGKMLRLDVERGPGADTRPEIWASGLRNPWRFTFDRESGDLWIGDVGQNAREEIDFQPASSQGGENYGWRRMEGSQCFEPNCDRTGLTMPVFDYGRSLGYSVTGGYVYRGPRYPAIRGLYFFADYGSGNLWGMRGPEGNFETRLLQDTNLSVSSFGEDEQGELYIVHHGGAVYLMALGPPNVSSAGIVNAASYAQGLVPGGIASIFGAGLTAITGIVNAASQPLPTALHGTSVTVNGVAAPLFAVAYVNGQEQINFLVPPETANSPRARVIVTNNGVSSAAVETDVIPVQPGLFAAIRRGEFLEIYGTGFGGATPVITIGGTAAAVTFFGPAPGFAGLSQINVAIPAGSAAGAEVVAVAGGAASNALRL
ncbi:MAG TPA: PQQ-dependent sugar dehydrogenase [Bryobacteraceae bacterium]|nr:PQQ-dependent sugar dehydrogenase [Bryobacteraceae bacterium]